MNLLPWVALFVSVCVVAVAAVILFLSGVAVGAHRAVLTHHRTKSPEPVVGNWGTIEIVTETVTETTTRS